MVAFADTGDQDRKRGRGENKIQVRSDRPGDGHRAERNRHRRDARRDARQDYRRDQRRDDRRDARRYDDRRRDYDRHRDDRHRDARHDSRYRDRHRYDRDRYRYDRHQYDRHRDRNRYDRNRHYQYRDPYRHRYGRSAHNRPWFGFRFHGGFYVDYGRYHGRRFDVPRRVYGYGHGYDSYYYDTVYYDPLGQELEVYLFPVYYRDRVEYRPYAYCEGKLYGRATFDSYGGLSFDLHFDF